MNDTKKYATHGFDVKIFALKNGDILVTGNKENTPEGSIQLNCIEELHIDITTLDLIKATAKLNCFIDKIEARPEYLSINPKKDTVEVVKKIEFKSGEIVEFPFKSEETELYDSAPGYTTTPLNLKKA